jgi:CRP/FNR family transcriptional regulator, anaerobic regulatory protein
MNPTDIFIKGMQVICPEISDDDLKEFESGLMVKHYKSKDYIFDNTKPHDQIVYIISGLVRSFYINEKGSEISAYFIKEFDFVSDYPAFLKGIKSNYQFEALENTTAVIIPKNLMLKAYEASPKFEKFGRLIAEEAVQFLQGRIEGFIFKSATERYVEFMNTEPNLFTRLSVEQIATYLGIERQSLTRIRKKINGK